MSAWGDSGGFRVDIFKNKLELVVKKYREVFKKGGIFKFLAKPFGIIQISSKKSVLGNCCSFYDGKWRKECVD